MDSRHQIAMIANIGEAARPIPHPIYSRFKAYDFQMKERKFKAMAHEFKDLVDEYGTKLYDQLLKIHTMNQRGENSEREEILFGMLLSNAESEAGPDRAMAFDIMVSYYKVLIGRETC